MLSMVKARWYRYSQWFRQGLTDVRNLVMICKEERGERERWGLQSLLKVVTVFGEYCPNMVWRVNVEMVRMEKRKEIEQEEERAFKPGRGEII